MTKTATMSNILTITQAAKFYPQKTHASTIIRHITKGIKTPGGVVKLEAHRMGGRWVTTIEALERFRDLLTLQRDVEPPPSKTRKAKDALTDAFLDSIGLT